ncbi:MAG TPA: hypothetical protein VLX90_01235 [Steroidobacteraceae bacterium]|nr:hypothetical protein [Steroidobacteraceae bacterium]
MQLIRGLTDLSAHRRALGRVIFDLRWHAGSLANRARRVFHGKAGDLLGDRLTLELMGGKNRLRSPAFEVSGEHPGEIHRIRNACIHSVARVRHPQMRSVSADERATFSEAIRDEPPSDPILLADQLVLKFRSTQRGPHRQWQPASGAPPPNSVYR